MYTFIVQNEYEQQLELTHNKAYDITEITGLDPAEATVNVSKNAGSDGSVFNSSYVNDRQIVITMYLNEPAEANRLALYQYFKPKHKVRIFYKNASRDVYIDGYTVNVDVGYFQKKQTVQITITCPQPYFRNVEENIYSFSSVDPLFQWEMDIDAQGVEMSEVNLNRSAVIVNHGDVETGMIITIRATGSVNTPQIMNEDTGEYFIIDKTMSQGDVYIINTNQGEKEIKRINGANVYNIIGDVRNGSTWLQLKPSGNGISYNATSGVTNMELSIEVRELFEGV